MPEQSLLITRTELTRRCCWLPDIELDEPLVAELVEPELELVGELEDEPALVSSVPVTSTRLPTSDDRSEELPDNT